MTQDSNQPTTLSIWWEELSFPEKELFELNDNGDILLKQYASYSERVISVVTQDNAEVVFKVLTDKFPEVQAKVQELETEWNGEEDKLKVAGKVERIKEYLQHTNAIGDFHSLFSKIDEMDAQLSKLMDAHFEAKLKLVQKAEEVTESDDWKETTQMMKDLADEWKNTGYLDKERNDQLWNRLEAARDKFFERKREHQEDINKEMLQNLDLKMELVEKAESLAASENWKETTQAFKELMDKWKGIGRTMHDKNEELWSRFITAKNAFFDKKKENYNNIKEEQEKNYAAKLVLVEKAESIADSTDWNVTTQAYAELMEEWRNIGRVPREKSDEIWNRLNAARDKFFQAKRENFEAFKVSLEDNYAQKLALLKRAEDLQHSNQWREATDELNELMTEWKKTGPVPREHSDEIWERFISARKKFFERKDANRERRKEHAQKREKYRAQQAKNFVSKLEAELREEEEKLVDFKEGLENITPGLKEEELREHLTKLIAQTEKKIAHKKEKLEEVLKQQEDSEQPATAQNQSGSDDAESDQGQ